MLRCFGVIEQKSIAILLALFLFLTGQAAGKYNGGTGEPNDPYRIATAEDLNDIGNHQEDWNKHFVLVNDVNLAEYTGIKFKIIGSNYNTSFNGVFDGNGKRIWNFAWNSIDTYCFGLFGYVGSDGQIKNLAMENLDVNAVGGWNVGGLVGENRGHITDCCSIGSVVGSYFVGGLVGGNGGTMTNCYSISSVLGDQYVGGLAGYNAGDAGNINHCYSTGKVSGTQYYIGGLVGYNSEHSKVINCYSSATVLADSHVGGLVGENYDGTIINCYSTGSVSGGYDVGGLAGSNYWYATITNCYSTGIVSGNKSVGGLVGWSVDSTITNCYSTGSISGTTYVGGLVGYDSRSMVEASFWDIETSNQSTSAGGTPKTTAEMKTISTFTEAGWDFAGESTNGPSDEWAMPTTGGYPVLWWQLPEFELPPLPPFSGGSGTPTDPYIIASVADINNIGHNPRLMNKQFVLAEDINLVQEDFYIIGNNAYPFTGVFDGNDHSIWGFTWTSDEDIDLAGLFAYIGEGGEIKNIGLKNADVNAVNGDYIGGLVGDNRGTIINCYSTGRVIGSRRVGGLAGINSGKITECYFSGGVSGIHDVGGLVGWNSDTITNCYSTSCVLGDMGTGGLVGANYQGQITNCYSTGSALRRLHVGGLIGYNGGTIADCYSTATVSGEQWVGGLVGTTSMSKISDCYSTGSVLGTSNVGGLVGNNNGGSAVAASFWDTETSGQLKSVGGTGKTTSEMKTLSTFLGAGWDFVDVWDIGEGQTYPYLRFGPAGDLDYDKKVDILDLAILASHWLEGKILCPPDQATNPNPANGTANVGINVVLSWVPGARATSHDVYLGTQSPCTFQRNQTENTFAPGTLSSRTKYYWRIDEVNSNGKTTGIVWSFTTDGKVVCFPGDTFVWLDGTPVKISEALPSQKASIFANILPKIDSEHIECVEEHEGAFECYDIMLETGNSISVADNHFFLLDSDRWVSVQELTRGLKLQSLNGPIAIKCVVKRTTPLIGKVYNLKIKDSDQYFVGEDGVVVRDY